jgi:hypothetical protein
MPYTDPPDEVEDHLRSNVCEETDEVGIDDIGLDELEVRRSVSLTEIEIVA